MRYLLMNKDYKLLSFDTVNMLGGTSVFEVERFVDCMPIGFTNIALWVENRNYAKHKESLKSMLAKWGIDTIDGFINITHCLGLNDTLWVKPVDSNLHWDDVSLYTNEFSDVMEKTAFGNGLNGIEISSTDLTSPEFVSPGSFAKCWRREEDGIYLYKTTGTLSQGLEPYSEYFASQIAEKMNIDAVRYELTKFNGRLCTRCKMFTSEEVGLISFAGVYDISKNRYDIPAIIRECEKLGYGNEIRQMYMLDSLILNQDRHLGNIGFLFDNDTFEIIGLSPIYDFNISMLCNAYPEDIKSIDTLDRYIDTNRIGHKTSDASFYDVAVGLSDEVKIPKDVTIHQHGKYNMDEKRFSVLKDYITLHHDRVVHKNPEHNRRYFHIEYSIVDCVENLRTYVKDVVFYLEITKNDFDSIDALREYRVNYGIGKDEMIQISVSTTGKIECVLIDEDGESLISDEIAGDRSRLVDYAVKAIKAARK